jgi:hypothetical protein
VCSLSAHALGQRRVIRHRHTAFAISAEILGWEETQTRDTAQGTCLLSFVFCAKALRVIFYHF